MIAVVFFVLLVVIVAGLPLAHWSNNPWKKP